MKLPKILIRRVSGPLFPVFLVLIFLAQLAQSATVNGVRVTCEDGSWGLVRASSNKPELVVVVESPVSEQRMRDMFEAMDSVLRTHPEVGEYNQKI